MKKINDKSDYRDVLAAMNATGFSQEAQTTAWNIVGSVLHLGLVQFAVCMPSARC